MWSLHTDAGNSIHGGQYAKNVYLGETRIVTKLCLRNDPRADAEELQQYFYHSDHLGSASLISDYKGDEYQRIEYTPYGETWIERTDNKGLAYLPYKFTAKELDSETGLYYYGARYLDSKYSTWISTDPALGDYIPQAPINDEARKHNQNLPGMGGIFNHINCNLYAYGANNPVRYIDPDGRFNANTFYQFASETSNKAQTVALADSPALGPCDVVAVGMLIVALGAVAIGGGINLYNYLADKIGSRSNVKVSSSTIAEKQTPESNAIRFQLQTGSDTPASSVRISNDKLGVKKRDAYGALAELYSTAIAKEPGLARCKDFTSAIIRMSEHVKTTQGEYKQGANVWRETFYYQGKEYRIDLENIRGINPVE